MNFQGEREQAGLDLHIFGHSFQLLSQIALRWHRRLLCSQLASLSETAQCTSACLFWLLALLLSLAYSCEVPWLRQRLLAGRTQSLSLPQGFLLWNSHRQLKLAKPNCQLLLA